MIKNIQITDPTQVVTRPTNHIAVVDCSGSMYDSLPKLREDLKNKLTTLVGENDKLSIIYFSGRNDSDFVFQNIELSSVKDLSNVKTGIDRYLKPLGLTAFKKPLELAVNAVDKNYFNSLLFITDGYNNDCSTSDVFKALEAVKTVFDACYFIEYGYYCDSKLLAQMAETTDGVVVTAEDFQDLTVKVSEGLKGVTAPKIPFVIDAEFAVGLDNKNNVTVYNADENEIVYLNGGTVFVAWGNIGNSENPYTEKLLLIYGNFVKGNIEKTEELLFTLEDKGLIETYLNAYGKQKINSFKQMVVDTIKGDRLLWTDGLVTNYKVDPNAYTVLDMLNKLVDGENLVYTNHERFNYNRIGAKKVVVNQSVDVKAILENVTTLEEVELALNAPKSPKFVANDPKAGVDFSNLVWNSSRANINFSVTTFGKVVNLPDNKFGLTEYPSRITRAYNICKDGILNLSQLPVSLDGESFAEFSTKGLIAEKLEDINGREVYLLEFSSLPIVNRRMLQNLTAEQFAKDYFDLLLQKAAQKVFRHYNNEVNERVVEENEELNQFLKENGITYNGFNPSVTKAESTDVYYAPELDVKIKGVSSLPSIDAVVKKRTEGKPLTLSDQLIAKYIDMYEKVMGATGNDAKSLDTLTTTTIAQKRRLEFNIAKQVMSIILGRKWFSDKEDYDDNKVSLNTDFGTVEVSLKYDDIEVKI